MGDNWHLSATLAGKYLKSVFGKWSAFFFHWSAHNNVLKSLFKSQVHDCLKKFTQGWGRRRKDAHFSFLLTLLSLSSELRFDKKLIRAGL